jgi:hypothetical protein
MGTQRLPIARISAACWRDMPSFAGSIRSSPVAWVNVTRAKPFLIYISRKLALRAELVPRVQVATLKSGQLPESGQIMNGYDTPAFGEQIALA